MTYLLDVNVLLAANWQHHPQHAKAFAWLAGKEVALCPLSELGFLRISSNPKAINAPMAEARKVLETFVTQRKPARIADDLPALESHAQKSEQVTDHYLAALADRHGYKLATLDAGIKHAAVEVIEPQ
jgi:toxin-antitoxin system PIN domain toxin